MKERILRKLQKLYDEVSMEDILSPTIKNINKNRKIN
jgi:hypothetical protein